MDDLESIEKALRDKVFKDRDTVDARIVALAALFIGGCLLEVAGELERGRTRNWRR